MEFFFNKENQVDLGEIKDTDTIQDFLDAVDNFLEDHPLDCANCSHNCCKEEWGIDADNIFVKKNSNYNQRNMERFITNYLTLEPKIQRFRIKKKRSCRFLSGLNKCTIYDKRPLVCRKFMCYPYSVKYAILTNIISNCMTGAFTYEYIMVFGKNVDPKDIEVYKKNPAVGTKDYSDITIISMIDYAVKNNWVQTGSKEYDALNS